MELSGADHGALRRLSELYFHGVDHRAPDVAASAFAHDCYLRLNVSPPMEIAGRESVREEFGKTIGFDASNHVLSSHVASVSGDVVVGTTFALAHLIYRPENGNRITVRGLRYDDEYRVEDGEWRIGRRIHNPLWQYEVAPTSIDGRPA